MKALKEKTCKASDCEKIFTPWSSLHTACSPKCAIQVATEQREKKFKKETTRMKREFLANDKSHWKQKATRACNEYIRSRDGEYCISCGDRAGSQIHAGHYKTRGAASSLQFHWANINSQCARCNTYLSGNIGNYRSALIDKVGLEVVEYLDKDHGPYKFTLDDYKDIHDYYKEQLKLLNAG